MCRSLLNLNIIGVYIHIDKALEGDPTRVMEYNCTYSSLALGRRDVGLQSLTRGKTHTRGLALILVYAHMIWVQSQCQSGL